VESTTFLGKPNSANLTLVCVTDTEALLAYFAFLINRRLEEGANQNDLVEPLGVSNFTISMIVSRKQLGIRMDNAEKIGRALTHKPLDETIKAAREWAKQQEEKPAKPSATPTPPTPIAGAVDAQAKKTGKRLESKIRADKAKRAAKNGASR
jgi:DNA-binding Xre family transcriptional regulator